MLTNQTTDATQIQAVLPAAKKPAIKYRVVNFPTKTKCPSYEAALISCLIYQPEIFDRLEITSDDFAEFGHGEAFDVMRCEYDQIGTVSPTYLCENMRSEISVNPYPMIVEWLANFVGNRHWQFYATRIGIASYLRHHADAAQQLSADINDDNVDQGTQRERCEQIRESLTAISTRLNGYLT